MAPPSIIVKRYPNEREYQRDAQRMTRKKYKVISVTSEQPRSGCMRMLAIGIFSFMFKPKPVLVVTYSL